MNKKYIVHNTNEDLESLKLEGVYLIRNLDNNMLKIGVASNLSRRYKQLISTFKHVGEKPNLKIECFIECEDTYGLESYLHDKFKKYNYQNEWFNIQDINYILKTLDVYEFKKITQKDKINLSEIILNENIINNESLSCKIPENIIFIKENSETIYKKVKDNKVFKVMFELILRINKRKEANTSIGDLINSCGYIENDKNIKEFKILLNKLNDNNIICILNKYFSLNDLIKIDMKKICYNEKTILLSEHEILKINYITNDNRERNNLLKLYLFIKIIKINHIDFNLTYKTIIDYTDITDPYKVIKQLVKYDLLINLNE